MKSNKKKCKAKNNDYTPCKNYTMKGCNVCYAHRLQCLYVKK